MAPIRTKQRGVIQLAVSILLAAMGTLVGATGCASDEDRSSGEGESLAKVQQGLACSKVMPCPEDSECGKWTCTLTVNGAMCTFVPGDKDGSVCKTAVSGQVGTCLASACCTGCITKDKLGNVICVEGTDLARCGGGGVECDNCNKGDTCQVYECVQGKRVCDATPVLEGSPCTNNIGACHNGSCCTGCLDGNDNCVPGTSTTQCGLSAVNDRLVKCQNCDQGNVCQNYACQNGVCTAPTPKAGSCADANVCNGAEVCGNGQCNPGTPLPCNDNNPCTVDSCDPTSGCKNTPVEVGTSCDDSTVCNGVSKCELDANSKIFCKAGTPPDCDDNNVCTTDSCDAQTGCKHTNNTADCSDNDLCTLVDKCNGGKCVGTGAPNCNDNQPCTTDACVPAKGCVNTPKMDTTACDDGNACTDGDQCVGGKCFGSGKTCDDMNVCTKNSCDPQTQACANPNENNGTACPTDRCHQNGTCQNGQCDGGVPIDCDDNNPCTTDSCDGATGCKHVNVDGGDCSDADSCTTGDKCKGGACVGTPKTCAPLDDCHVAGTCDPKTGACDDPRADDDTSCDNGNGTCLAGKCDPLPGAGGAGGVGAGGEPNAGGTANTAGTGGTMVSAGGETVGPGGDGNEPGVGGVPGEAGTGGTKTTGGSVSAEGGEGIDPERAFVRDPGGCSCSVPSSQNKSALLLAGLAAVVAVSRRRRQAARRVA